jgi:hypothetical protein
MGFVDVPGHERFVRNMLAGISAIDLALLVIAADDGPMPQTREHLAILELLGARRLAVVLTKIGPASAEQKAQAIAAIDSLLEASRFAGALRFEVETPQNIGSDSLRHYPIELAQQTVASAGDGEFRLAIDRSFSVSGAGRVVTGAALSGKVAIGDSLTISPLGIAAAHGELEIARLLLAMGAAVDGASNDGTTPLLASCAIGHLPLVRLLLSLGAPSRATQSLSIPPTMAKAAAMSVPLARTRLIWTPVRSCPTSKSTPFSLARLAPVATR